MLSQKEALGSNISNSPQERLRQRNLSCVLALMKLVGAKSS